jgi:hypothetical protein
MAITQDVIHRLRWDVHCFVAKKPYNNIIKKNTYTLNISFKKRINVSVSILLKRFFNSLYFISSSWTYSKIAETNNKYSHSIFQLHHYNDFLAVIYKELRIEVVKIAVLQILTYIGLRTCFNILPEYDCSIIIMDLINKIWINEKKSTV